VQRHLAGTQGDDPPPGMVDLDHHLLAARREIVFGEGVAMGDLIELVALGDVLHCPVRLVVGREPEALSSERLCQPKSMRIGRELVSAVARQYFLDFSGKDPKVVQSPVRERTRQLRCTLLHCW
jgi:hypothetical protein